MFNPAPLLNPGWFEGRMSSDEWVTLISQINECTISTYVGKPKLQTTVNGQLQGEDPYQRAYAQLRPFLAAVSAWWLQHRGINIACTMEAPHRQQLDKFHSKMNASTTLHFAILPAPAAAQLPRTSDGTYVLTPPPAFAPPAAASDEGQTHTAGTIAVQPRAT
jgi:hypothetical protein